jgi:recombinational DNA repair protein RecR
VCIASGSGTTPTGTRSGSILSPVNETQNVEYMKQNAEQMKQIMERLLKLEIREIIRAQQCTLPGTFEARALRPRQGRAE